MINPDVHALVHALQHALGQTLHKGQIILNITNGCFQNAEYRMFLDGSDPRTAEPRPSNGQGARPPVRPAP